MKATYIFLLLVCIVLFLPSCKKEKVDVTGLYQWSKKTNNPDGENKRSIKVSEDKDGNLQILLKDKFISISGDTISNYLDTEIVINSDIQMDKVITVYSETNFNRSKHELIFEKNLIKWRYCVIESFLPDGDVERLEDKDYCILNKHNLE